MIHRFIESYDTGDSPSLTLGGHTYPDLTLIEDSDGNRVLLLSDVREVPVHAWVSAHANGAGMIAVTVPGPMWACISAEFFMAQRTEHAPTKSYLLPGAGWVKIDEPRYWLFREAAESAAVESKSKPAFVQLHAHSEYSALDGLSKVQEMVDSAVADEQPALAVTDHGVCSAHPELQRVADKAGIKPIFGIETYLVDDRLRRPVLPKSPTEIMIAGISRQMGVLNPIELQDELKRAAIADGGKIPKKFPEVEEIMERVLAEYAERYKDEQRQIRDYYHLILWAQTDVGLRNLWAMTTESNVDGFYIKPRIDWDTLSRLSEGVMASTGCLRGPLSHPLLDYDDATLAQANLGRLLDIFGDKLYVELHTNQLPEQRTVNEWLVAGAELNGLPTIAVTDSHYPCHDDHQAHKVWLAIQTNKDLQDETNLFASDDHYHLMTIDEVKGALSYLPEDIVTASIANTVAVADRCNARVEGKTTPPVFTKKGSESERIVGDVERLVDICVESWGKTIGKSNAQEVYIARFEREMDLLKQKDFCGYFLMVSDYCLWAKSHNILVGPGRGSGGGSLVAYLCGITEIDPVEANLMFERFLTYGRKGLPDFDVDFPASKREEMTKYLIDKYGEDSVMRVGTHIRVKNKAVFKDIARAMKSTVDNLHWPDIEAITQVIDRAEASTAGAGLKWDELMAQHGDELAPWAEKYPEIFKLAERMVGRLKTYGKHAAGVVISPDMPITDRLPAWVDKKTGRVVAEFAMGDLEELGFVKFDILTIRTLDTIQMAMDLVRDKLGVTVDIYNWRSEYEDAGVWGDISDGHTLGMFQVETPAGTRLCKRFRPQSMDELSDVITLVRPGPMRSGLTETYFRRKSGQEPTTFAHPILENVLHKTYGCMLYQEDVMNVCQVVAGYSLEEADEVRKMLGKKEVDKAMGAADQFVQRSIEHGVITEEVARFLGDQMVEFAKYSFNRSHAWAYAMIGYWTAWLKHHYPLQFLTAALSTVDSDRIPDFVIEARRLDISILPPDINKSGHGFSGHNEDRTIRYGLDAIPGVGEAAMNAVMAGQPYSSYDDFLERKGDTNMGVVRTLASIGVFDSLYPHRAALMAKLSYDNSDDSGRCASYSADFRQEVGNGKETWWLPCTFKWDEEPVTIGASGRPLKAKAPAKKCTKACRNYTPAPAPDFESLEQMSPKDIRKIEQEVLGLYLSSSPFDAIGTLPEDLRLKIRRASEVEIAPAGSYIIAAIVTGIRTHIDRRGDEMAFLKLFAQDGSLDVTVFSKTWVNLKNNIALTDIVFANINKSTDEQSDRDYVMVLCY